MRDRLKEMLSTSMKAGDKRRVSTVRLILAAIKDRDIANRSDGTEAIVGDDEILSILQKMVKQRRDSAVLYKKGGRFELAAQEEEEICIIDEFLPLRMGTNEISEAVAAVISETGANSLKNMGGIMSLLKERYVGRMDFAKAAQQVKRVLSNS